MEDPVAHEAPGIATFNKSDASREDAVMMYIENYYIGMRKSMEERAQRCLILLFQIRSCNPVIHELLAPVARSTNSRSPPLVMKRRKPSCTATWLASLTP